VEGTECDVHAAEEARRQLGCVVHNGEPTQLSLSEDSFDAVTLQHVIEHHPDPIALVAECRRVLAPQGHLVIMTPNARGWGHRRYGHAWRGLEPPRHLLIHTRQSIDHVVREAGFKSYWSMTTPAGAEYFIAASRQIRRRMAGRKSSLRHGMLFSVSWLLQYEEFLAFSADAEAGDEIVCLAQK
jgi:ubiquinone/menaquinone biosynthesis C-methylase UbiE